jgi:hypothetical protein
LKRSFIMVAAARPMPLEQAVMRAIFFTLSEFLFG